MTESAIHCSRGCTTGPCTTRLIQRSHISCYIMFTHFPSTPQKLEAALWIPRVALAYDQMLIGFAAYPEVWIWIVV